MKIRPTGHFGAAQTVSTLSMTEKMAAPTDPETGTILSELSEQVTEAIEELNEPIDFKTAIVEESVTAALEQDAAMKKEKQKKRANTLFIVALSVLALGALSE